MAEMADAQAIKKASEEALMAKPVKA